MKYLLLTLSGLALMGCNTELNVDIETDVPPSEKPNIEITANPLSNSDVQSESITTVAPGEACGGPEDLRCEAGLYCIKEVQTEENFGTCQSIVADNELECSNVHDPVCGLWRGEKKMGFQNPCQLERHGAEMLNEGFCGRQNSFEEPCEAKVLSIGINCNKYFTGYQFNNGACEAVNVQGCDVETPFDTLEACASTCG